MFYSHVAHPNSSGATNEFLASVGTAWIDVRDLAEAHVISLEKEAAGGERIIVSAGTVASSIQQQSGTYYFSPRTLEMAGFQ
jgi:nucleoside-diphosphate-sugar epimerase